MPAQFAVSSSELTEVALKCRFSRLIRHRLDDERRRDLPSLVFLFLANSVDFICGLIAAAMMSTLEIVTLPPTSKKEALLATGMRQTTFHLHEFNV